MGIESDNVWPETENLNFETVITDIVAKSADYHKGEQKIFEHANLIETNKELLSIQAKLKDERDLLKTENSSLKTALDEIRKIARY